MTKKWEQLIRLKMVQEIREYEGCYDGLCLGLMEYGDGVSVLKHKYTGKLLARLSWGLGWAVAGFIVQSEDDFKIFNCQMRLMGVVEYEIDNSTEKLNWIFKGAGLRRSAEDRQPLFNEMFDILLQKDVKIALMGNGISYYVVTKESRGEDLLKNFSRFQG